MACRPALRWTGGVRSARPASPRRNPMSHKAIRTLGSALAAAASLSLGLGLGVGLGAFAPASAGVSGPAFYVDHELYRTVGTPTDLSGTGAPDHSFDTIYQFADGS